MAGFDVVAHPAARLAQVQRRQVPQYRPESGRPHDRVGDVGAVAAADAEPADLYPAGDGRFEFDRTVSRLEEMRSDAYLEQGHGAH